VVSFDGHDEGDLGYWHTRTGFSPSFFNLGQLVVSDLLELSCGHTVAVEENLGRGDLDRTDIGLDSLNHHVFEVVDDLRDSLV
jgi:hypothetical protein